MMKIALITGASSGLGREFARQIPKLYQNLDEIWVVARRAERLNELEMELKVPVRIFDGDLNQNYIYKKLGIALGKSHANVRMLVNAAGYGKIGTFCEYGWKEETGMVDLNCRSLTRMTALCLPYMHCGSRIAWTRLPPRGDLRICLTGTGTERCPLRIREDPAAAARCWRR